MTELQVLVSLSRQTHKGMNVASLHGHGHALLCRPEKYNLNVAHVVQSL